MKIKKIQLDGNSLASPKAGRCNCLTVALNREILKIEIILGLNEHDVQLSKP